MMDGLLRRGEAAAAARKQQRLQQIARQIRSLVGNPAVRVEEARVLVSGPGIIKRWLVDPGLRFVSGALR